MGERLTFYTALVLLLLVRPVPAPFPRCSPFIIVNKFAETTSILSDLHPYYPIQPCEYGGPLEALNARDVKSVFLVADPLFPKHVFYETIWLLKTGIPRIIRVAMGREKFEADLKILGEAHNMHYTRNPRTRQLGHGSRRPEIIDDSDLYNKVVSSKINELVQNGPDRQPTNYTPEGPLRQPKTPPHSWNRPEKAGPNIQSQYRSAAAPQTEYRTAAVPQTEYRTAPSASKTELRTVPAYPPATTGRSPSRQPLLSAERIGSKSGRSLRGPLTIPLHNSRGSLVVNPNNIDTSNDWTPVYPSYRSL